MALSATPAATAMASQAHLFHSWMRPRPIPQPVLRPGVHLLPSNNPFSPQSLTLRHCKPSTLFLSTTCFASATANSPPEILSQTQATTTPTPTDDILSGSTRTLATIFAMALSLSGFFLKLVQKILLPIKTLSLIPGGPELTNFNLLGTAGPLFFASLQDRPAGNLNTPLTVVAAGLGKWIDIYTGVLLVRVLLSWFPNIPWERQPLSAIRDLCDPYLSLFRNIIPPVFDTLDVSPLLAFTVLGVFGSILQGSSRMA